MRELCLALMITLTISCTQTDDFSDQELRAFGSDNSRSTEIQNEESTQNVKPDLPNLLEKSDLIVIAEVTESRFLVDSQKREVEIENALRESRLPRGDTYIGGNVYDIAVIEVVYGIFREDFGVLHVYSTDNPFSLHSRVAPLIQKHKYLLLLSKANDKSIDPKLKLQSSDGSSVSSLNVKNLFQITDGNSESVVAVKNNDQKIKAIRSLVRKLIQKRSAE
jgi:hypothetical protein